MVRRVKGPNGFIINLPVTRAEPSAPPATQGQPAKAPPNKGTFTGPGLLDELPQIDPRHALLVIPCSGDKAEGGDSPPGPGLCDALATTGPQLRSARERVRIRARVDERRLMPAIDRYTGEFYKEARAPVGRALDGMQPVVILSGGYGAVLPGEPIGWYAARFRVSWWPGAVVARCLAEYAQSQGISTMVAVLAETTDYAKELQRMEWSPLGIVAYHLWPDMEGAGGGMRAVPRASGEAVAALLDGDLTPRWRSRSGLRLRARRLL
jgi:hypothetical protein